MTLNKRALLVLFPVILLGYGLAAGIVYRGHRAALIGLDKATLAEQVYELQSTFAAYKAFDTGLLNVMRNSNALLLFINETDDAYRSEALGVGLQDSIQSLSNGAVGFVSCAIFQPDRKLAYYYDSSQDPFSGLSRAQFGFAHRSFSSNELVTSGYITETAGTSLVVISGFVSAASGAEPVRSQKARAFMIQIAVRPTRFDTLRTALEAEYGARIELAATPYRAEAGISQAFELEPGLYSRLTAPPAYLGRPLRHAALVVLIGGLIMSLVSVGLLMRLVRRYITGPVEELDRQVTEVMTGLRRTITASADTGEVGRLSENVETLHTRAVESLQKVHMLYCTDALTGIGNRAQFNMISVHELEHAHRAASPLTMLFMDLDNFKFVNDRYGHETGDAVLRTTAQQLVRILAEAAAACAEAEGSCARLSGDEFAILIRSDCRGAHVTSVIMAVMNLFKGGLQVGAQLYPVTPSIGIASVPGDAATVGQLLSSADAAMYQAKETGRNGFSHFSPEIAQRSHRRGQVEKGLKALDRNREFSLVYMPIVNRTGKIVACEALLRWRSPVLGLISPAEFIPIAESIGLFLDVDDWVIDHAMADHDKLAALFGDDVILGINISSAQLYTQGVGVRLGDIACKHALRPSLVAFELTEPFTAGLNQHTRQAIESVRVQGFGISIDDFGVGCTSVQQILEYPADTIKLDRMIVEKLVTSSNLAALRSIIAFCHALGMKVTAEGVDTIGKSRALLEAQCDHFQGFGISAPLALEALAEWQRHLPRGLAMLPGDGWRADRLETLESR